MLSLLAAAPALSNTSFPDAILGVWESKAGATPQSILGPLSYRFLNPPGARGFTGGFSALRDGATGDVWFTVLDGQVFHIGGKQMQYCFGPSPLLAAGMLAEQSPFQVDSVYDKNITFCWREGLKGMPTHSKNCRGCDCAKIQLKISDTDADEMDFWFWQSPPVTHAHITFTRTGKAPTIDAISSTMTNPYEQCDFVPHYGPNAPYPWDDLTNQTNWPDWTPGTPRRGTGPLGKLEPLVGGLRAGCAAGVVERLKEDPALAAELERRLALEQSRKNGDGECHQLNGFNHLLDGTVLKAHKTNVPDVKLQYIVPTLPCDPCDVAYSVSAEIDEDNYIAAGFKGQSWEHLTPYNAPFARPSYFGMAIDAYDNFTSDRLALGYASPTHGSCLREMVVKDLLIGAPKDADFKLLKDTSVERSGKRTILRFTATQHWPNTTCTQSPCLADGPFRVMWATGALTGDKDCAATPSYHGVFRGVSPVRWLNTLGSIPCDYDKHAGP